MTILARTKLDIQPEVAANSLKQNCKRSYQPWSPTRRYTEKHELLGVKDFWLYSGGPVPVHSDGIAAYRPLLMLENHGHLILGVGQCQERQPPGTLLLLDIEAKHWVTHAGGDKGWLALAYEPDGWPIQKSDYLSSDEAMDVSTKAIKNFLEDP